jgi:sugar lactone lactonase YvrE
MRRSALLATVLLLLAGPAALPAEAHPPPSVSGFEFPESVWWDGDTGSFYVTNFGGSTLDPNGREPDGYLSKLSGEGSMRAAKWVTGLRSPKGMRRVGDTLYVADVGQVVVIDVAAATVRSTIDLDAIGAQFPNDVALDEATGDVYVSDMLRNAIYRLPKGAGPPEVWLESPDLEAPNGLLVDGGVLMVASFGRDLDPATFTAKEPGRVLEVDLASKAITPLGSMERTGQLDGIEKLDDGYLVTDNPGGRLLFVTASGAVAEVAGDLPGAADLGLRSGDRVAAVPQLMDGVVRFIDVPAP